MCDVKIKRGSYSRNYDWYQSQNNILNKNELVIYEGNELKRQVFFSFYTQ